MQGGVREGLCEKMLLGGRSGRLRKAEILLVAEEGVTVQRPYVVREARRGITRCSIPAANRSIRRGQRGDCVIQWLGNHVTGHIHPHTVRQVEEQV